MRFGLAGAPHTAAAWLHVPGSAGRTTCTDAARRALAHLPDVHSERLVRSLNDIADAPHAHRTVPCVTEYLDTDHAAALPPAA
ncbi:hypothetical protein [Kitasatospora sp. NPDC005856]|uniref:hypothetical protein n=1 Tax=Kitasatospora sp. NPDC005856 TaxID=3154566 RepID=UPI0033F0448E